MKLAIIGFGGTGVSFFVQFIERFLTLKNKNYVEIFIISPEESFIGGNAFNTREQQHLLNTPAHSMGTYSQAKGHFNDWLKTNNIKQAFLPRSIFHEYLKEQYYHQKQQAINNGVVINEIKVEALSVEKVTTQFKIQTKNGILNNIDTIVYSPGFPPSPTSNLYKKTPLYSVFNYNKSINFNSTINAQGEIAILGSGLTAIDAIFSAQNYTAIKKIHVFSRQGLLPSINVKDKFNIPPNLKFSHITKDTIKRLLINNEFSVKKIFRLVLQELSTSPINELTITSAFNKRC